MSLTNWTSRWVHALAAAALRREAPIIQGWVPVLISLLLIGMWCKATHGLRPHVAWFATSNHASSYSR